MTPVMENPRFREDFERLRHVTLDPARHSAAHALEHSRLVAGRAAALATANGCGAEDVELLRNLGYIHDIGKCRGTTHPSASVDMLPDYGLSEPRFVELVRMHDVNLPWFISVGRGEAPSDKAWRKLAARVDMRLLCLFMVADRADCPGGWRANAALVWFLDEARRRGLISSDFRFDPDPGGSELPS